MSVSTQRNRPMISDPNIIPRVRKYLEEHVDQTYVDVGVMAKELQDKYSEYTRRKTVPFRILVEQAYKLVLRSYGLDSNPSSDNEDGSDADVELMEDNQGKSNNHMNDTMSSLYMTKNKTSAATNDGELIDISSDDDDEGDRAPPVEPPIGKSNGTVAKDDQQQPRSGPAVVKMPPSKPMEKTPQHTVSSATLPVHNLQDISITPSPLSAGGKKPASPNESQQMAKKRRTETQTPLPALPNTVTVMSIRGPANAATATQPTSYPSAAQTAGASKPKRFKKEVKCVNVATTFEDIGGMDKTLTELCELLVHVEHPEIYRTIGLPAPRGFLLHGPPGCGKSLLAHAIAGTLDIPLIKIPATELVAGVSGESEERIREVFEQAAALAPCVLFIDEIDVISSNRQNASKDMERRIVSQLIGSMDALSEHQGTGSVIVVGATSRPDTLDPALRRVGRFDHEICLGIPDRKARYQILHMICYDLKLEQPFDYDKLAALTPGYVGADLLALAQRAASTAIKRVFGLKQEEQAEQIYQRSQSLSKSAVNRLAAAIGTGEVVNLTDDTLIMDVDDVEVTSTKEAEPEVETTVHNGEPADEATAMAADVVVPAADEVPKELESTDEQIITTTTEAELNGGGGDDNVPKLPEEETVTIPTDETMDTSENGEEKVTDVDGTATVEKPAEEVSTVPEEPQIEVAEALPEQIPAPPTEEPAPLAEPQDDNSMVVEEQKFEEPKAEEPKVEEPRAEEPTSVATVPKKKVKLTLTLESMMQWLTNDVPVLTEDELKALYITMDDFVEALKHVQPSAKREGFITIPDVTWKDIGSLQEIRDELKLAVLAPVRFPDKMERLGLTTPSGVLLCGPPGCGKTLLAKAVANEAGINFISVKGPELLNMYVGESERAVRQVFQRARNSAPCVIFFDEFDALCPKRSDTAEGGGSQRVVNQLLTEMDGIEDRKGVFLMAATNRPDIVDPAVLRPGRLDKILYVGLPDTDDRVDILRAITRNATKPPLSPDVDFQELAEATTGFTGADLAGLMRQAALQSLKTAMSDVVDVDDDDNEEELIVKKEHIMDALAQVKPSVSEEDIKHYEKLKRKYGTTKKDKV